MTKAVITYHETSNECEVCGWYTSQRLELAVDGHPVLTLTGDDHMAEPLDTVDVLRQALQWLGYSTYLNDKTHHEAVENPRCKS